MRRRRTDERGGISLEWLALAALLVAVLATVATSVARPIGESVAQAFACIVADDCGGGDAPELVAPGGGDEHELVPDGSRAPRPPSEGAATVDLDALDPNLVLWLDQVLDDDGSFGGLLGRFLPDLDQETVAAVAERAEELREFGRQVRDLPEGTRIVDLDTGETLWDAEGGFTTHADAAWADVAEHVETLVAIDRHLAEAGFDSIDGAGHPLIVNLNRPGGSASWSYGGETSYNSADGWDQPHVIAHEFGHGFLSHHAGFHSEAHRADRTHEQDAFAEGFADIISYNVTGATDRFDPQGAPGDPPYRSMRDPAGASQPAHVDDHDPNRRSGHHNSSIVSHAYYLMVEGDEAAGVDGIGQAAAQQVFYDAVVHLDEGADYTTFRDEMRAAAADNYGEDSEQYRQVVASLEAVGLDEDWTIPDDWY
ncbi:M4 family metallopeptidase [Nitriliruptoraceae bacterium ZYF776]|nr:M4 family metallopeptidase [Profundirhabdus halotolerans]